MNTNTEWLQTVCCELLCTDTVPVDVAPLALGMNSLTAVRLAARISTEFDADLNPAAVLRASRLSDLVEGLRPRPPADTSGMDESFIALSHMQLAFYIANQIAPGGNAYHCPLVWRLDGPVNRRLLELALDDLARRHPVMRGTLAYRRGELGLAIADQPIPRLRHHREADEAAALARVEAASRDPLITARGEPLWQALLVEHGDGATEGRLFALINHHMLVDWMAAQVLLTDLSRFHAAREEGDYPRVNPTPSAYVLAERRKRDGANAPAAVAYWKRELTGASTRSLGHGGAVRHRQTWLPGPLTESLRALAARWGTTLHNVLLACFAEAYHDWCGSDDVVIGVSYAFPRTGPAQSVSAPLMNTLCVRSCRTRRRDLAAMTGRLTEKVIDAILHSELPVAKVASLADAPVGTPLFDVFFNYQELSPPTLDIGVSAEALTLPIDPMFPVVVVAMPHDGGIRVSAALALPEGGPDDDALLGSFAAVCESLAVRPTDEPTNARTATS
ncbi:condensation domain-containing protein [Streptomyces albidoflavus]|uniref:condensation domain-containing protein n=1 Tax=Streptomyces albidoflavus TaxID=1886 RepID=UPI0033C23AFC